MPGFPGISGYFCKLLKDFMSKVSGCAGVFVGGPINYRTCECWKDDILIKITGSVMKVKRIISLLLYQMEGEEV